MGRFKTTLSIALALVAGCAHKAPAPPPAGEFTAAHFRGSALALATTLPAEALPAASMDVSVKVFMLAKYPMGTMGPLETRSTLITSSADAPLKSVSAALADARLGTGQEARQFVRTMEDPANTSARELGTRQGMLAPGIGLRLGVRIPGQWGNDEQRVDLVLSAASGTALRLGLSAKQSGQSTKASEKGEETDVASVELDAAGETAIVIVAPLHAEATSRCAVAFAILIRPAGGHVPDPAMRAQVEADLRAQAATQPSPTPQQLLMQATLQLLGDATTQRATLAYLADQVRADLCLDVALSADGAALGELSSQVGPELGKLPPTASTAQVAWALDRMAFDLLAKLQIEGKLSRPLAAVLLLHAGEAGRSTSSLEQLLGKAASRKDLENRLMAENLISLEDASPAARVRAYDYLAARGQAPRGYDPLGPPGQRKKSLSAAIEAMSSSEGGRP